MDMPDYVLGRDVSRGDDDGDILVSDDDEDEDEDEVDDIKIGPSSDIGYDWEADAPVQADVELYLEGLLWNLQTYQDGVCTNYGYTYGNHMSPSASEIEAYLKAAMDAQQTVGPLELVARRPYVSPLPAGMSCLAALPTQVEYLVPEPYRQLATDDIVEGIYADCMESDSNVFNMDLFRRLVQRSLMKWRHRESLPDSKRGT